MSAPAFSLGKRPIGGDAPVFVIAELSANHAGKLDVALRTIEAAAKAGADAIKLQTYTPDTLTLKSDAEPFVIRTKNVWAGRTLHDLYAEAMTPWEWHAQLRDAALSLGLEWLSSPFDATAVQFLADLGAPAFKIASFEIVDVPLVEAAASHGRPMIISTGMASLGDVEAALAACRDLGNDQIALLRCVSAYPAQPSAMHLRSIATLRELAPVVGLSDHTRDSTAAIAAVALGAKIVEKHFILDRSLGGPDAFFSLEPDELKAMVDAVRATEAAVRGPRFGPGEDEIASTRFRRSLFVARDVAEGEILTCDSVRSVRPSLGLPARHLPEVLGRRATRAIAAATPLEWAHVGAPAPAAVVGLRAATSDDAEALLAWRNDPLTRRMSRSEDEVAVETHRTWLRSLLSDPRRHLFVASCDGADVGQVRLDAPTRGAAEVSLTVAPAHRGRGLAAAMLRAIEQQARDLGLARLVASIRPENEASLRAFKAAGWYGFVDVQEAGLPMVRCERSLRPVAP